DDADGALHRSASHVKNALRETFDRGHRAARALEEAPRPRGVERGFAAQQTAVAQMPQHEMCIGDRRLLTAPVTDGAGIRAGAFRADTQRPGTVKARERTTAGADRVDIQHGNGHGKAGGLRLLRGGETAIEEGHIGGGAAHVKADDAGKAGAFGDILRAQHSARGPRKNRSHRLTRGSAGGKNSAGRLHYTNERSRSRADGAGHLGSQTRDFREIAAHHRDQIGVNDGRGGALEFAELREDFVRDGNGQARGAQAACDGAFVLRTQESKEQAYGDRIRPAATNLTHKPLETGTGGAHKHAPFRADAFVQAEAPLARYERLGKLYE